MDAEISPLFIKSVTYAQTPVIRIYKNFITVKPVSVGPVSRAVPVTGDLPPGMLFESGRLLHSNGGTVSDDFLVEYSHEDTLGIVVDLPPNMRCRVGSVFVNLAGESADGFGIGGRCGACVEFFLRRFHKPIFPKESESPPVLRLLPIVCGGGIPAGGFRDQQG